MNNSTPPGITPYPSFTQGNGISNTSGRYNAEKRTPQKFLGKRTPRRFPGSTSTPSHSSLPPVSTLLSPAHTTASETAPLYSRLSPQSSQIHGHTFHNNFHNGEPYAPNTFYKTSHEASHPDAMAIASDQGSYHSHYLAPAGAGAVNDALSDSMLRAPITKQPEVSHQTFVECGPSKRINKNNSERLIFIDLTRDDLARTTQDKPSDQMAASSKAEPEQSNGSHRVDTSINSSSKRQTDTAESSTYIATGTHVKASSPSPSNASSDLPSTSRICEMLVRDTPCKPNNKRGHINFNEGVVNSTHHSPVTPRIATIGKPMEGQKVVDDVFVSTPAVSSVDKMTTFRLDTTHHKKRKSRSFDTSAFDTAIYQQLGAQCPPRGVVVLRQQQTATLSEDRRQYIHANPAIHGMHNRPQIWYTRKALEIQARGGRKFWFGKVAQRMRWLQKQRTEASREQIVNGHVLRERSSPEPQTYTRPLDFGDVPESELPDEVQDNPDWLKACEWFRQQQNLRGVRLRESKRCEQEANEYYEIISRGGVPDLGPGLGD